MLEIIRSLPEQLSKAAELEPPRIEEGDLERVVFAGMGGSAIAGDIVKTLLWDESIPIEILRDYSLPGHVNEKTLLVAVSYSGNTEETISVFEEALKRNSKVAVVTSDGELKKRALDLDIPFITIPSGFPPRGAVGWLTGASLKVLAGAGLVEDEELSKSLKRCSAFLKKKSKDLEDLDSEARELAEKFYLRIPLIYSSYRFFPVAYRWQTQINENAKAFAHAYHLPEMNHNEITGLRNPEEKVETMWAVFLKTKEDHPRIELRIKHTIDLIRDSLLGYTVLEAEGEDVYEETFYLILFGDFVSFFLAQAYAEDPLAIPRIDQLKERLRK